MKNRIIFCLFAAVLILVFAVSAFAASYGDIYKDGAVNAKDATKLAQYIAGWNIDFSAEDKKNADVFYDGAINAADAVKLAQYLASWNVTLGPSNTGDVEVEAGDMFDETTEAEETTVSPDSESESPEVEKDPTEFTPEEYLDLEDGRYKLTFFDGFDTLDKSVWQVQNNYVRQNGACTWDSDMVSVSGGNLVLSSAVDSNGTLLTGAVRSRPGSWIEQIMGQAGEGFEQARGYFEARVKLQTAQGIWSAFWLMCDEESNVGNGENDGAEIDIMESFSPNNGAISNVLHWDGYGDDHKSSGGNVYRPDLYDGEYHTFALLWTDTEYVFYIDGKESRRISGDVDGFDGTCTAACYLKLSIESASWVTGSDGWNEMYNADELATKGNCYVDYVRVYQKES